MLLLCYPKRSIESSVQNELKLSSSLFCESECNMCSWTLCHIPVWWQQFPYLCWMPCCYDFRPEDWIMSFFKINVFLLWLLQFKRHFKLLVLERCWAPGFWWRYSDTFFLFLKSAHPIFLSFWLSFSKSAWEYQSWEVCIISFGLP